jgi:hypothetical protein
MSSNFNNAKIINVYYNKGDRKPYDVNGKPIAYIGEEAIGATEATTIRFYLGEQLDSSTAVIVTKRPDGERRLDLCELVPDGVNSYYQVTLNSWYGAVKGKATLAFKVYNGEVEFDDEETPTEIISVEGRIVVSDIFNLEIAYAPEADLIVPADDTPDYVEWFAALSTKLDKAQSIMVKPSLPTSGELAGNALDDRYFYVQTNGVGRLYYVDGSTPIEVVFQIGTLKLTSNGNEDINVGTNAGKMYWDEDRGTIIAGLYDDQEAGVGDSLFFFGKATEAIAKGEVVQFNGNTGGNINFKKAVFAQISAQPDLLMGVAKHAIPSGDFGYVVSFGYVRNLNTTAYDDPILYLSTSVDGALSSTKPTTGFKGSIAAVARPSTDGNNGFLIVRPNLVKGIGDLANVTITTATSGEILSFDGSKWVNSNRLTTAESNITNLQGRMTTEEANVDNLQGRMTSAEGDIDDIESGATIVPRALGDQNGNTINTTYLTQSSASATYIPLSQKAQANGVATLGADGKVTSSQIPAIVSSVEEYPTFEDFPTSGVLTTVYLALDTQLTYLWSGSQYVALSSSLALGESSTTAYRGDRGKEAYDYSQVGHLPLAGGTVTGNLVVGGDLTISGTTTTIDTETVGIKDNIILINSNQTGVPSSALKGGLEIERGDLTNFQFVFDESDDRFKVGQIGSLQTVATRTDDGTIADRGITFFNTSTNRLENNANIVIDSDNKVGIGTASPAQKLDVQGNIATANNFIGGGKDYGNTGNAFNSTLQLYNGTTGNTTLNNEGFGVDLQTNSVSRLFINNAGNVGIGTGTTTSPEGKLHVASSETASRIVIQNTNNSSAGAGIFMKTTNAGTMVSNATLRTTNDGVFSIFTGTTTENERLTINSSGNVGIGTTSPTTAKLEVANSSNVETSIRIFTSGVHSTYIGNKANDTNLYITNTTAGGSLGDAGKSITLNSSGNVGIGTTSPQSKLHINGSGGGMEIAPGATTNIEFINRADTNASVNTSLYTRNGFFSFHTAAYSERLRITNAGDVGIGTASPDYTLDVNGSVAGNSAYVNKSDARLKQNIETITNGLDIVMKLRPVQYKWKKHPTLNFDLETTELGFTAQEVQQALAGTDYVNSVVQSTDVVIELAKYEEIVKEDGTKEQKLISEEVKQKYFNLAESKLVAILTKAIQELAKRVEELESK